MARSRRNRRKPLPRGWHGVDEWQRGRMSRFVAQEENWRQTELVRRDGGAQNPKWELNYQKEWTEAKSYLRGMSLMVWGVTLQ